MIGMVALPATILTDFLCGVGIADDADTIPAAVSLVAHGRKDHGIFFNMTYKM